VNSGELSLEKVITFRRELSRLLTSIQVYDAVDYGKQGADFTVAMPQFKLKGKPDDLTREVTDVVSQILDITFIVSASSHILLAGQSGQLGGVSHCGRTFLAFPV
jgi:hypothetical protein